MKAHYIFATIVVTTSVFLGIARVIKESRTPETIESLETKAARLQGEIIAYEQLKENASSLHSSFTDGYIGRLGDLSNVVKRIEQLRREQ